MDRSLRVVYTMTEMARPKPSMTFEGYIERIDFHFDRLGVGARPTQKEYVDAWNNQIPAKKMAQTFARRQRRQKGSA